MKARVFLLALMVLSCSAMVDAVDYCIIKSEGDHIFTMQRGTPTYTMSLSKPYTTQDGFYVVCPGTSMSISNINSFKYVCDNEMSAKTPVDMYAWVYSGGNMLSLASNFRTLIGTPTREYVFSTSCAIPFNYGPGGSSMNVYTFNNLGDYTVYLDYVRAFRDEGCPACYICPNHPTPASHPCSGERRGWVPSTTYKIRVSSCAAPTTTAPPATNPPTPTTIPPFNGAQYVSQSVPNPMCRGKTYAASVTMKNTGTTTWTSSGNYRLGSQNPQDNTIWGGRIYLSASDSIVPGAFKTFSFSVTAPSAVGTYNFQWRMVQDGVIWFGDSTPNVAVSVIDCTTTTAPATTRATTTTSSTTRASTTTSSTSSTIPFTRVVTLRFIVNDDRSNRLNCTLFTNVSSTWKADKTLIGVNANEVNHDTLYGVPEGMYGWTVNCTDGLHPSVFPRNATRTTGAPGKYWIFYVKP